MTPDEMNPDICPSALDRSKWDGAHRWYQEEGEILCSECGAEKTND